MKKRLYIGIYIGPGDKDLAAWFNLLQFNNLHRSKWVRGLLMAYTLGQPLYIGTVSPNKALVEKSQHRQTDSILTGYGHSESFSAQKRDRYGYGWHIRGANKEIIVGSVINVSIGKPDELTILREVKENGHQIATFVKALIRKNLCYGEQSLPPDGMQLQQLQAEFVIQQAKVPLTIPPSPAGSVCSGINQQKNECTYNITPLQPRDRQPPENKQDLNYENENLTPDKSDSCQESVNLKDKEKTSEQRHFRNPLLDRI